MHDLRPATCLELSIFVFQLCVFLGELSVFVPDESLQLDHQLFQVSQPLHHLLRWLRLAWSLIVLHRDLRHQLALAMDKKDTLFYILTSFLTYFYFLNTYSVLVVHLCVSIRALLSRELLEDCGQPAEHEDGTLTEGKIRFEASIFK